MDVLHFILWLMDGVYLTLEMITEIKGSDRPLEANMNEFETMVEMIKNAYISVYGEAKWNSLMDTEKHDAVMYIAKDFGKLVGAF